MTSGKVVTTVGFERRYNASLLFHSEHRFIEHMTVGQPPRPANMLEIVAMNQGHRPYSWQDHPCPSLSPSEVERLLAEDVRILDTRESGEFALGHAPGAWNVQLSSPQFEQRVGWILPPEQQVVLVVDEPGRERLAVRKLSFVGLDQRVRGSLDLDAWRAETRQESMLTQVDVCQLHEAMRAGDIDLLDVREDSEWAAGHVAGAFHRPLPQIARGIDDLGLDPDRGLAVMCAGGFRSSTACSLLVGMGFTNLRNVTGGMEVWNRFDLPVVLGQD